MEVNKLFIKLLCVYIKKYVPTIVHEDVCMGTDSPNVNLLQRIIVLR